MVHQIYKKSDIPGFNSDWKEVSPKARDRQGRIFSLYEKNSTLGCEKRTLATIKALLSTIFSLGTLLCTKTVRTWWAESLTGVTKRSALVYDETKTQQVFKKTVAPVVLPTRSFPSLLTEPLPDSEPLPPLSGLEALDPSLNEKGDLFLSDIFGNYRVKGCQWKPLLKWPDFSTEEVTKLTNGSFEETSQLDERVKARIDLLDASFQIKTRLYLVDKMAPWISSLFLNDLESPWAESALFIALLTDDEIGNLPEERLSKLSGRQYTTLRLRLEALPPLEVTGEPLTFAKLRSSSTDQLKPILVKNSALIKFLTGEQLLHLFNDGFLTKDYVQEIKAPQVGEIDFSRMDIEKAGGKEVLNTFFGRYNRLLDEIRSAERLYPLLPYLNVPALREVNLKLLADLDFSRAEFTPEKIRQILLLDPEYNCEAMSGWKVENLSPSQVIYCLENELFDPITFNLRRITDKQLKEIDLSALSTTPLVERLRRSIRI